MRLGVEAALVRGELVRGDIAVENGRVTEVGLRPSANGRIAVPGFVDLQVNGFGGIDFLAACREDFGRAGEALLRTGVTAYQPTLITAPEHVLIEVLGEVPIDGHGPRVLGVHLEGPFLSHERLGIHPAVHRRDPDLALLDRLLDAGHVSEMTVAPELPGADALIARLLQRGVLVSAGHTNATAAEARRAFDLGVASVSHLFNAMRPLQTRDPGIVGEALIRDSVVVTVIVDGHHLADETVRLVWACAAGRVALVTDAIAAAAMGPGTFRLGEMTVSVSDGAAPVRGDGALAGTVLSMIEAVQNLNRLGAPLEEAIAAATSVPARLLGCADVGTLDVGAPADIVLLDDRLEIVAVFCSGEAHVVAHG